MEVTVIGIDVSKDRLDVCIHPAGEVFAVDRDGPGIAALIARAKAVNPYIVAVEATGGYEGIVTAELTAADLQVVIVNPAQVRAFAYALGQRAKTDPIDASVIARFVAATKPPIRPLPDEQTRLLADLTARRRQIIQMRTAERQREKMLTVPRLKKSVKRLLKALERELAALEEDIDDMIRSSPVWRDKEDLMKSVPGIGNTIARTILAEIPEIGSLSRREIASLAGLAPFTRQSGKWRGKSFISGGRAAVRSAIYMGALVASRYNPVLKDFYQKLVAAGKPKLVAIIAIARKLLTILNAIIREKTPWQQKNA